MYRHTVVLIALFAVSATAAPPANIPLSFQWINPGPTNITLNNTQVSGKLQAFAWSPAQPQTMYAGGGLGSGIEGPFTEAGAFRSTDGGNSWTRINQGLTDNAVDVLWADPSNASLVLAGTEFGGLFRSADGGQSWTQVSPHAPVSAILSLPNGLLAGTGQGFELSTDGGLTWTLLQATTSPVRCMAAAGSTVIAGLERGEVLWKSSTDAVWHTVATNSNFSVWAVALDPVDPRIGFFIRAQGPGSLLVERTTDSGATWQIINPPTGTFSQAIVVRPSDRAVLVAGQGMFYKSLDSGTTWTQLYAPWDTRSIFPISNALVIGSDHGLHWTDNDGITWRDISASISCNILLSVATSGQTIFAAAQDFGPLASFDGGTTWTNMPMSEGGSVAINPADPRYCYAFVVDGYHLSTDGCRTFTLVSGPVWQNYVSAANQNLITVDPHTPSTVYVGSSDGVWRSTDWGSTVQKLSWPMQQITQVVLDPEDVSAIFVCSKSGLWRSLDAGTNWTKLNLPNANAYPFSAAVSPIDSNTLLIALNQGAGRFQGGVLRSSDRGQTFSFVNQGLSTLAYNLGEDQQALTFNPSGSAPTAALATTTGIYATTDYGDHWQDIRFNAVARKFSHVLWKDGYLWTATEGEGVLRSDRSLSPASPVLGIAKTHSGNFIQGQMGATYTVTVSNGAAAGPTTGTVTVAETVPTGMTLVSMAGTGWTCPAGGTTCTRSDALNGGVSYPPITVTVNVASNAGTPLSNSVSVSGGGSANNSISDSTVINANPPVLSTSIAVFRASGGMGVWALDNGNNVYDAADKFRYFGLPGDQAVAGDWTGTGQTRLGVFRNGLWYLDLNNNGQWDGVAGGDGIFAFGLPGDVAVVGDWNGDGRTKLGIFRCPPPGAGGCTWVLDMAGKFAYDPATAKAFSYGLPGDTPVVNNWNGTSNVDQIGVYRAMPNGLGLWIVDSNGSGGWEPSDAMYWFGLAQDAPVVGNWNNGARKRIGVFRNGIWILDTNGNNAYDVTDGVGSFGLPGDQPVVGNWSIQ